MKVFAWYAGGMTVVFALFTAWVFAKARHERPGDATLDFAFVGLVVYVWALAAGGAGAVLWRRWIDRAPVSPWFWIPAAGMLLGSIGSVARFALDAVRRGRATS